MESGDNGSDDGIEEVGEEESEESDNEDEPIVRMSLLMVRKRPSIYSAYAHIEPRGDLRAAG